ncbi:type VI secretion system lipoprotein TssJ [Photobacterium sp. SKA34]|uniref:type VI secretion system lipoprotein TssJ n=1 Tax=Photobacterium sp. SKA34 TaxID=121723 RepID=UPI0002D2F6AA|nr:type VI secretion system lipoprotein TssJ [Photobacterium sp. SKA34]
MKSSSLFHMVFIFALTLMGCSSKYDPASEPSTITISMVSTDSINTNGNDEASPVELKVFELEDDSMFNSASYDQLAFEYKKALKSNYVDVYDYVVLPNKFKFVEEMKLDEDTRYIGVMALFSDSDNSDWKKSVKVKTLGRDYHLLIYLKDNQVVLDRVE